jgi:hypothetical protein
VDLAFFKSAPRLLSLFAGILGQRLCEFFPNPLDVSGDASQLRASWRSSSARFAATARAGPEPGQHSANAPRLAPGRFLVGRHARYGTSSPSFAIRGRLFYPLGRDLLPLAATQLNVGENERGAWPRCDVTETISDGLSAFEAEMASKAENGQIDSRISFSFTGCRQMRCLIVIPRNSIMPDVQVSSQAGSAGPAPVHLIGSN